MKNIGYLVAELRKGWFRYPAEMRHPFDQKAWVAADALAAQAAEIERLRADNAVLRDALERCPPARATDQHKDFANRVATWWRLWARPALAQSKEHQNET